jgi:NitT/TauT family transport system substrate-binding protein
MEAKKLGWLCSSLIFFLLAVLYPASTLAQRNEVFVLVSNHFPYYWNSYVGVERGFFADENLDVKIVAMGSAELSLKGIIGGSGQVALTNPIGAILARRQGAPVTIVGSIIHKPLYELIAAPRFRSIKDLKGETLAVQSMFSAEGVLLRTLLQRHGLSHPRDFTVFQVAGGTRGRLAAVTSGRLAAALLVIPTNVIAIEQGMVSLGTTVDIWPSFEFVNIVADQRWLSQKPEATIGFLTAMLRANRWLYNPRNKREAAEILTKYTKLAPKHAELAYDAYLAKYKAISPDGSNQTERFQQMEKVMMELGQLDRVYPMEEFVDKRPLERALERVKGK